MYSDDLEKTMHCAFTRARESNHEFVTVSHLLLSMLDDNYVGRVLHSCGADIAMLKNELEEYIDTDTPKTHEPGHNPVTTIGFQRVFRRAARSVNLEEGNVVRCEDILVAIYGENESHAVHFLHSQNVFRSDIERCVSRLSKSDIEDSDDINQPGSDDTHQPDFEDDAEDESNPLTRFTRNLNDLARKGKIDPLIGRKSELKRTIEILFRKKKNNPLLVGDAGVGKTAIAEGLAKQIVENECPELANSTIYSLDMTLVLAGTKYRGTFEKRLSAVIKKLKRDPHAILFIDEIHTVIGAGSASGSASDAANILKPVLVSGEIRCIGSTTQQEYRTIFEKDTALCRRFLKIDINEPSVEETGKILLGLKSKYEEFHNVRYTRNALLTASKLAGRYISDRRLPDKAIDVIDEAGARAKLPPTSKRVDVRQIEQIVAGIARIPPRTVSATDSHALKNIERDLNLVVFGQDEAINSLAGAFKLSRSGLGNPERPISSFLFSGPTGVGKTEVTRQLAFTLGIELIRFDMSEYMEPHSVSRLIGAPPGYIGFQQGGQLTEAVNKTPYAVLLLDEIEKAHPDVFNVLLQVMDYGTLTDNSGRKTDFRNVIIIMTTNAGAVEISKSSMGFTEQDHSLNDLEAINSTFKPEFRNRLSAVIRFKSLDEHSILRVVDKFLEELEEQLREKNTGLQVSTGARRWIANKGFDSKMGARPMDRIITDHIKKPVANELLHGSLANGGKLKITVKGDELSLSFTGAK